MAIIANETDKLSALRCMGGFRIYDEVIAVDTIQDKLNTQLLFVQKSKMNLIQIIDSPGHPQQIAQIVYTSKKEIIAFVHRHGEHCEPFVFTVEINTIKNEVRIVALEWSPTDAKFKRLTKLKLKDPPSSKVVSIHRSRIRLQSVFLYFGKSKKVYEIKFHIKNISVISSFIKELC